MAAKTKHKTKAKTEAKPLRSGGTVNDDGTITVPATATVNVSQDTINWALMELRGFLDGMPMDKYRNDASCEKASPGIIEAGRNSRGSLTVACTVTIDINGYRTVALIPRKKEELLKEDTTK